MANIQSLEMPKWGMTMEEGTIVRWNVSQGDTVQAGDSLAEAESSKLSGDLEAPISGILARIIGQEGETYPVGQVVAVVAETAVSESEIDRYLSSLSETVAQNDGPASTANEEIAKKSSLTHQGYASAPRHHTGTGEAAVSTGENSIPGSLRGSTDNQTPATPHAAALAEKHGIDLTKVKASGRGNRVTVADLQKAVQEAGGRLHFGNTRKRKPFAAIHGDDSGVWATIYARKLAEEHGVNLLGVRPSGRGSRVTRDDVRAWIALNRPSPPLQQTTVDPKIDGIENPYAQTPLSTMRRVIGSRLKESYLDSPHFRVSTEAHIDKLLDLRQEVNNNRLDLRLTINDLVTAAVAQALVAVPRINAQYDPESDTVRQFEHADIAIAVSTEEGLITPIVRGADKLSPSAISARITDLSTRAKAGTLKPEEFQGGTFTISNLGMFGVSSFDAIINPPQVAILAVGGARRQFVPDPEGNPVDTTLLTVTLSADHRVIDGATGARFCQELKNLLETPALIFA